MDHFIYGYSGRHLEKRQAKKVRSKDCVAVKGCPHNTISRIELSFWGVKITADGTIPLHFKQFSLCQNFFTRVYSITYARMQRIIQSL